MTGAVRAHLAEAVSTEDRVLQGSQTPEPHWMPAGEGAWNPSWQRSICPVMQRGAGQGQRMDLNAKEEGSVWSLSFKALIPKGQLLTRV